MQQGKHLADGFGRVRGVEEAIELTGGCTQTTDEFSLADVAGLHSLLCLQGQAMEQEAIEIRRIAIVLEDRVDVDGVLLSVCKPLRESLHAEIGVWKHFSDPVGGIWTQLEECVGERVCGVLGLDLEHLLAIVGADAVDLHSSPSSRSSEISRRIRRVGLPVIGAPFLEVPLQYEGAVAIHVHMMRAVVTLPGHEYEAASPGLSHADMLPRTVTVNKADKC